MADSVDAPNSGPAGVAVGLGWAATGLLNAAASTALQDSAAASGPVIVAAQFTEVGRHLAMGLVCGLAVWAWGRFAPPRARLALIAAAVATLVAGGIVMFDDAAGFAGRTSEATGVPSGLLHVAVVAGASQLITAAWWGTTWLTTKKFGAIVALFGALAVYAANTKLWHQDNAGLHFFMSWTTATVIAALVRPRLGAMRAKAVNRFGDNLPTVHRIVLGVALLWAVGGFFLPTNNSVKIRINGWSANLLAMVVSSGIDDADIATPELTEEERGFFVDRSDGPDIAPTDPPLIAEGKDPIVIVLTVDALRYDVVGDAKNAQHVPNILALAEQGASFSQARTPGSQTVYTLSGISTGKYFSQQYWKKYKTDIWLHDDESVHLASLLNDAGVITIAVPGAKWLSEEYGVLRGFAKGKYRKTKSKWTHGENLTKRLIKTLKKYHRKGPLFIYCHYLDPHSPYNRGENKDGEPFDRYLSEVALDDGYIKEIADTITELGIEDRTMLVVSSDHGEAFGEHGVEHRHSVNLYEELIHVPLIVRGPGVEPREISQLVSAIDLGPTILDVFGAPTPSVFMGQSLVPLLQGKDVELKRPIASEGRLKQAMVFPNGLKVIRNPKKNTVEIYDLNKDPGELTNLSDQIDLKESNEYRMLKEFFSVHTLKKDGYKPPFRK